MATTSLWHWLRDRYPDGALTSTLLGIQEGQFLVQAALRSQPQANPWVTAFGSGDTLTGAEDQAHQRLWAWVAEQAHQSGERGFSPRVDAAIASPPETAGSDEPASPRLSPRPPAVAVSPAQSASTAPAQVPPSRSDVSVPDPEPVPDSPPPSPVTQVEAQVKAQVKAPAKNSTPAAPATPSPLPDSTGTAPAASPPPPATTPLPPPVDLSDIIAQTGIELQRLGWTEEQGRDYLKAAYGKLSRHQLTDEELLEFLLYLEGLPNPVSP